MVIARAEWHPFGPVPFEQGAFDATTLLVTVAAGAYSCHNDGDRHPYTANDRGTTSAAADLDRSLGLDMHREAYHSLGIRDARSRSTFLQAQIAF